MVTSNIGVVAKMRVKGDQLGVFFFFFFLFKSCIRLFKGTKNSHAAVSYGVNKTYNKTTNKRKSYPPSSPERSQTMTQLPTKGKHYKLVKKYPKPPDLAISVKKQ